jgi:hypothetical protein
MNTLLGIILPVLMLALFAVALAAPYLMFGGVFLGGSKIWNMTAQHSSLGRITMLALYVIVVLLIYLGIGWLLATNTMERGSGIDKNIFILVWPFTLITYVW